MKLNLVSHVLAEFTLKSMSFNKLHFLFIFSTVAQLRYVVRF